MTIRNLYAETTASIIAQLKAGVAPWRQKWSGAGTGGMPRNAVTNRAYSGINIVLLWSAAQSKGFTSPLWLTFKQALDMGGNVRKGEKGTTIVYVGRTEKEDEKTGEDRVITFLKSFTVFNVAQCDGLTLEARKPAFSNTEERDAIAEEFVQATGARLTHGEGRAYYSTRDDRVNMPAFETFVSADAYYSTLFHELTHWTGAKARCDREFGKRFGDRAYAVEELVAELGAAFLCAEFGMDHTGDAASYIASWIRLLETDDRLFMTAAAAASKACDHLRGLALTEEAVAA